jgi:hypothetical protein
MNQIFGLAWRLKRFICQCSFTWANEFLPGITGQLQISAATSRVLPDPLLPGVNPTVPATEETQFWDGVLNPFWGRFVGTSLMIVPGVGGDEDETFNGTCELLISFGSETTTLKRTTSNPDPRPSQPVWYPIIFLRLDDSITSTPNAFVSSANFVQADPAKLLGFAQFFMPHPFNIPVYASTFVSSTINITMQSFVCRALEWWPFDPGDGPVWGASSGIEVVSPFSKQR